MNEKSARPTAFYRRLDSPSDPTDDHRETLESLPSTAGPWTPEARRGGPPAALLARAVERLPAATGTRIGRFTMELLGPVPVGPVAPPCPGRGRADQPGPAAAGVHRLRLRGQVARSSQALLVVPRVSR
ncbi:acyl-CoA thioesterase domain-containing protein [Nocardioides sp.]|uniref:acyl-CoA thioesterase domain-containing protein n=1 Tax=Nocardioides sp. TaxID=35761 RepID=UPI0034593C50